MRREDAEYALRAKRLDIIDTAVRLFIPWGFLALVAYWVHKDISVLAGKQTLAQIGISFLGDIRLSDSVAYIFGVAGTGYGIAERQLRRRNIARLSGEKQELERLLDAGRTSSNLTRQGTTRPEDNK